VVAYLAIESAPDEADAEALLEALQATAEPGPDDHLTGDDERCLMWVCETTSGMDWADFTQLVYSTWPSAPFHGFNG
jgi:hypothetical protein